MCEYLQPRSEAELIRALGQRTPSSRILAGGTDLMVEIREKRPEIDCILSLRHVPELRGIAPASEPETSASGEAVPGEAVSKGGKWLRIGSMETHDRISRDPGVREFFPALAEACEKIGSQQIRNLGTIGGNLCNATPADDTMPCMVLFEARAEILDAAGRTWKIPASGLVTDFGRTCIGPGEVLKALWLPIRPERKSAFVKLGSRRAVTIAQLSFAVSWEAGETGAVTDAEGFLGAVSLHPVRIPEIGAILTSGTPKPAEALAAVLRSQIRQIRETRKRPSRMKITEAEQLYKERAALALAEDILAKVQ